MRVNASLIHSYLRPSQCDLRIYLLAKGEQPAPPGPYDEVLVRLGRRHEAAHLAGLGPYMDLSQGSLAERAERTQAAIGLGERVLYQPVFMHATQLAGQDVQIVGVPDFLVREGREYVIRDAKLALHADEDSHPEILRQLELYHWLYERCTGRPPKGLQVVTGDSSVVDAAYDSGQAALGLLDSLVQTMRSSVEPYSPVGWSKCLGCGFRERCWQEAKRSDDVAMVYGVDQGLAVALHEEGTTTITQLVDRFDADSLSSFQRPWGKRRQRVGRQAGHILLQAQSMLEGKEILLAPPSLPPGDSFGMFDLEGLPPQFDELDKVYLWGTQVFGARPGGYQAALAHFGIDGDRQGWSRFLDQAQAIFEAYGDIPFVHWHHYETTKLRGYIGRYGDPNGVAGRVMQNCVDLLPITREAIVLPDPSYSLKVVEQRVGYKRKLEEYGGDWSIARYIEAVETDDESQRDRIIQEIMDYNREDLEATWAVFQWLRNLPSSQG